MSGLPLRLGPALCKGDCSWNAGTCKAKAPQISCGPELIVKVFLAKIVLFKMYLRYIFPSRLRVAVNV